MPRMSGNQLSTRKGERSENGHRYSTALRQEPFPNAGAQQILQGLHGETDSESTPLRKGGRPQRPGRTPSSRELCIGRITIGASFISVVLCGVALVWILVTMIWGSSGNDSGKQSWGSGDAANILPATENSFEQIRKRLADYSATSYDSNGRFILEDFDVQQPFSDFLPALAGYYGKPLYAFYVNRGQGIASFGLRSKEFPIQEFHSANLAYQQTPFTGFRTFLQISPAPKESADDPSPPPPRFKTVEPFGVDRSRFPELDNLDSLPKRNMYIGLNEMQLQEIDLANGIETNVTYFILPEEDFGAFVKRTSITNILPQNRKFGKSNNLLISILDGLAKVEPGTSDVLQGKYQCISLLGSQMLFCIVFHDIKLAGR